MTPTNDENLKKSKFFSKIIIGQTITKKKNFIIYGIIIKLIN